MYDGHDRSQQNPSQAPDACCLCRRLLLLMHWKCCCYGGDDGDAPRVDQGGSGWLDANNTDQLSCPIALGYPQHGMDHWGIEDDVVVVAAQKAATSSHETAVVAHHADS